MLLPEIVPVYDIRVEDCAVAPPPGLSVMERTNLPAGTRSVTWVLVLGSLSRTP